MDGSDSLSWIHVSPDEKDHFVVIMANDVHERMICDETAGVQ